ncbi:MAG: inositol monophosphatase [Rhodospirillales bacterium]|nr:inositol monophosphatase [Rhodospirillales bacterium]
MALSPNINVMIKAAEKAGRSLVRDFGEVEQLQVSRKGPGDFVSAADLRAEEIIFKELSFARSDFGFLMEESGVKGPQDAESIWIVDPLDGTNNFLHGIPHWCISIALEEKGEIVAGIIHDPVKDETFRAEKGNGAFMKNKRLRVSARNNLEGAMIACGQPSGTDASQFINEYTAMLKATANGVRRYGAAALDLAYVAAGRYEGFWERGLKAWDMAAGCIIIKEAGGRVSDIAGTKNPVHERNILAGNAELYDDLKKVLHSVKQEKDAA